MKIIFLFTPDKSGGKRVRLAIYYDLGTKKAMILGIKHGFPRKIMLFYDPWIRIQKVK